MLNNADIHAICAKIQQHGEIIPDGCVPYYIELDDKQLIKLYEPFGQFFSIPTNKLSDIHAILQLYHPNKPYYICHNIYLSQELPGIYLYSYKHAPNILTTQFPDTETNSTYTIQLTSISQTTIEPNEPITDAIARIRPHAERSKQFVHQYPHININARQLNSLQKIPHTNDVSIDISTYRKHSSGIHITMTLCTESSTASIGTFIIPIQHVTDLTDKYITHMHHAIPELIQDIQYNFTGSQHEKMHIIRQVIPYLTRTDNNLFSCVQDCVHILINHYTCVPLISPP